MYGISAWAHAKICGVEFVGMYNCISMALRPLRNDDVIESKDLKYLSLYQIIGIYNTVGIHIHPSV